MYRFKKKGFGNILTFFLVIVFLLSMIGIISYYIDEGTTKLNRGVLNHEDLEIYCVEKGQDNFTNYNLVRPPYGCNYNFSFTKNKWIAEDEINLTNFRAWLENRDLRTYFDDDESENFELNLKTITDIFVFFLFFIIMMHNLISVFGIEKIHSFKIALISVFGLPIFMISAFIVYTVANWFMNDFLTSVFSFFVNTLSSDYPLFYLIFQNFGALMVVYGILWFLAFVLNFHNIADRLKYFGGGR
jgi:hypothetical protein